MQQGVRERIPNFLTVLRDAVYGAPGNPLLALLRHAGCEYEDVERLVRQEGLEGALRRLYQDGVYLTVHEFKGRRPVVRGSLTLDVRPERLRNRLAREDIAVSSGGSRGRPVVLYRGLNTVREYAAAERVAQDARDSRPWRYAQWQPPGGGVNEVYLRWYMADERARPCWFTQVDPKTAGVNARYAWSYRVFQVAVGLAGRWAPEPRFASLDNPEPLLEWLEQALRRGGPVALFTIPSSAVTLARMAQARGLSLRGVVVSLSGEPLTATRRAAIEASGAAVDARYGAAEASRMGLGCCAPISELMGADDMHLMTYHYAVIHARGGPAIQAADGGLPERALLVSTLYPTSPLTLINTSLGDEGDLEERECGCPLEEIGWKTHLSAVSSFEKLTARGMTFLTTDVIRILEDALPRAFGGGPADYQLVEQPTPDGASQIRLRVHPRLGHIDEDTGGQDLPGRAWGF